MRKRGKAEKGRSVVFKRTARDYEGGSLISYWFAIALDSEKTGNIEDEGERRRESREREEVVLVMRQERTQEELSNKMLVATKRARESEEQGHGNVEVVCRDLRAGQFAHQLTYTGFIWPAAVVLSSFLVYNARLLGNSELIAGRKVMELGAGLGLCSQMCVQLDAEAVYATDLVEPDLSCWTGASVADRKEQETHEKGVSKTRTHELRWGYFGASTVSLLKAIAAVGGIDLVVGSDLLYEAKESTQGAVSYREACHSLLATLSTLASLKKKTMLPDPEGQDGKPWMNGMVVILAVVIREVIHFEAFLSLVADYGFRVSSQYRPEAFMKLNSEEERRAYSDIMILWLQHR